MQLTVNTALPGIQRGMPFGTINDSGIAHRFNDRRETFTITITYSAAQTHTVTITGIPHGGGVQRTVVVGPVTGDTDSATTAQAILVAIQASALANSIVSTTRSSAVITAIARRAGDLTITGTATGGGATTVAATVTEEQLEAGVGVVYDSANGDRAIRRPFTPTAQVTDITGINAVNATYYAFLMRIFDSTGALLASLIVDYTSDASATIAEIRDGLIAKFNLQAPPNVTAATSTNDIRFTASGGATFTITEADSNLAQTAVTASVNPIFGGVTMWPKTIDAQQQPLTGDNVWPARTAVHVMIRGRIGVYVDQAVTPASDVYMRVTTSGANTVLGAFRADADSGTAIRIRGARFIESASAAGVAVLEINNP